MKKGLILALVALIVVPALAVMATSGLTVWQLINGSWVEIFDPNSEPDPTTSDGYTKNINANARAFKSGDANGRCNKEHWEIEFTTEVQVAQWIEWSVTGTKWTWYVRKPGTYITDCIEFSIKSNGPITIGFSGFASPTYVEGEAVKDYIDAWYSYGYANTPGNLEEMVPAALLDECTVVILDSQELHDGITRKLWNMIDVANCNTACTYRDTGTITITLMTIKPWIDPETGYYKYPYPEAEY